MTTLSTRGSNDSSGKVFVSRLRSALAAADFSAEAAGVYFDSLRNRYRDIAGDDDPASKNYKWVLEMKELEKKRDGAVITMSEALRYERLAVRCATDDFIPGILRTVRSHYQRFCTTAEFKAYLDLVEKNPDTTARDEIDMLIGKIHDTYVMAPFREKVRGQLSMRISLVMVLVVVAVLALCGLLSNLEIGGMRSLWWLVYAAISGAIGGLVSVHYRIQALTVAGDAIRGALALVNGWFSVYFAPMIGAISASLLAMFFKGGLIQGALFPEFDEVGPLHGAQLAKLLVWCFAAGFIERLVPDTLTRLSAVVSTYGFIPTTDPSPQSGGRQNRSDRMNRGEHAPNNPTLPTPNLVVAGGRDSDGGQQPAAST